MDTSGERVRHCPVENNVGIFETALSPFCIIAFIREIYTHTVLFQTTHRAINATIILLYSTA